MQSISPLFAVEAEKLIDEGKIAEAIELCRRGLEEYPGYAAGTVALAKALSAAGEAEQAKREIEAARAESSGVKAFNAPLIPELTREVAPESEYESQPDLSAEELSEEDFSSLNTQANEEILLENFSEDIESRPEGLEESPENVATELLEEELLQSGIESDDFDDTVAETPSEIELESEIPSIIEEFDSETPNLFETDEEISSDMEIVTDIPIENDDIEPEFPQLNEIEDEIPADMELEPESMITPEASVSITDSVEFDNVYSSERVLIEIDVDTPDSIRETISERFDLIPGLEFFRFESKFRRADYTRGLFAEAFDFRTPGDLDALAAALSYATVPAASARREELFDDEPTKPAPFMTETIANLYVLQGEFEQARRAFLRLAETTVIPEKSIEYKKKAEELQFQLEMRKLNQ